MGPDKIIVSLSAPSAVKKQRGGEAERQALVRHEAGQAEPATPPLPRNPDSGGSIRSIRRRKRERRGRGGRASGSRTRPRRGIGPLPVQSFPGSGWVAKEKMDRRGAQDRRTPSSEIYAGPAGHARGPAIYRPGGSRSGPAGRARGPARYMQARRVALGDLRDFCRPGGSCSGPARLCRPGGSRAGREQDAGGHKIDAPLVRSSRSRGRAVVATSAGLLRSATRHERGAGMHDRHNPGPRDARSMQSRTGRCGRSGRYGRCGRTRSDRRGAQDRCTPRAINHMRTYGRYILGRSVAIGNQTRAGHRDARTVQLWPQGRNIGATLNWPMWPIRPVWPTWQEVDAPRVRSAT